MHFSNCHSTRKSLFKNLEIPFRVCIQYNPTYHNLARPGRGRDAKKLNNQSSKKAPYNISTELIFKHKMLHMKQPQR